jgi:hypothetical protein
METPGSPETSVSVYQSKRRDIAEALTWRGSDIKTYSLKLIEFLDV